MSLGINALDPKDRMTYIHPDPILHPLGICQFCGISVYPHPYGEHYVWQAFPGQPHHHPMCVTEDTENSGEAGGDKGWRKSCRSSGFCYRG